MTRATASTMITIEIMLSSIMSALTGRVRADSIVDPKVEQVLKDNTK